MSQINVKKNNKYLSIDEIDSNSKRKFKITSPRSLSVMKKLGVSNSELHFITYKQFLSMYNQFLSINEHIRSSINIRICPFMNIHICS